MATITVRGLDDDVQLKLKAQAAANNRSMEAEARAILTAAVRVDTFMTDWLRLAADYRAEFGGIDLELPERSPARELDLGFA